MSHNRRYTGCTSDTERTGNTPPGWVGIFEDLLLRGLRQSTGTCPSCRAPHTTDRSPCGRSPVRWMIRSGGRLQRVVDHKRFSNSVSCRTTQFSSRERPSHCELQEAYMRPRSAEVGSSACSSVFVPVLVCSGSCQAIMIPATAANTWMRPGGHCSPIMQITPATRATTANTNDARARRAATLGWIKFMSVFFFQVVACVNGRLSIASAM